MSKESNEMRILREFVVEFSPFYSYEIANEMNYDELFVVVGEIVESHNKGDDSDD